MPAEPVEVRREQTDPGNAIVTGGISGGIVMSDTIAGLLLFFTGIGIIVFITIHSICDALTKYLEARAEYYKALAESLKEKKP